MLNKTSSTNLKTTEVLSCSINMEKAITSITRNPLSSNMDLYGIGGRDIMKIIKLSNDDLKDNSAFNFKLYKNLKTARCSSNVGTTDLQWNLVHGN